MFGQLIFWDNELKDRRKVDFDVGQKIKIAHKQYQECEIKKCPESETSIEGKKYFLYIKPSPTY